MLYVQIFFTYVTGIDETIPGESSSLYAFDAGANISHRE